MKAEPDLTGSDLGPGASTKEKENIYILLRDHLP
jgi:hypothetical protein